MSAAGARRLSLDDLGQARSHVPDGRLHPWFLAGRMAPLTRHNFTYGPTIHVRTQIQHRGTAVAEQEIVVGARIVEVYERKGHWYQVLDGLVVGAGGGPAAPSWHASATTRSSAPAARTRRHRRRADRAPEPPAVSRGADPRRHGDDATRLSYTDRAAATSAWCPSVHATSAWVVSSSVEPSVASS